MATERQRAFQLDKNISNGKKDVQRMLKRSKRAISGTIAEHTAKKNFATNAAVRAKLYSDLAQEYRVLNKGVEGWISQEANTTAKNFWMYAKEDLPKGAVKGTFGAFSSKYVEEIIQTINPSTIKGQVGINAQLGGMLANDIRVVQAAVSSTIAEAAVEGLTNPQMAARMTEKVVDTAGKFTFIDKGGKRWTADNYFGMLNRTLHANTARQSYIDTATKELGYDLYVIEGGVTGSSVDNPDDPCDSWAGKIISMTGNTKGYPTYNDAIAAGVFHQNCTHFIRAILPSEIPEAKADEKLDRKKEAALPNE